MAKKIPCQGKHRSFGSFAKTHRILFAQVVNFLILNIQDIAVFVAKSLHFSKSVLHMKSYKISEIGTGKISSQTGKTQGIF